MPQITTARIRTVDHKWRSTVNKFRGPIPMGLVIAHIVVESNGDTTPVVNDAKRSTGLMKVPFRVALKYGYTEEDLEDPIKNIYVWCVQTNKDSERLHKEYPSSWTEANYDYWLSLRLIYKLGFANYNNLAAKVTSTATANQLTAAIQSWIRNSMSKLQRFGTFRARDLRRIADELDLFKKAMMMLDGPNTVSKKFHQAPGQAPGGEFEVMRALGT